MGKTYKIRTPKDALITTTDIEEAFDLMLDTLDIYKEAKVCGYLVRQTDITTTATSKSSRGNCMKRVVYTIKTSTDKWNAYSETTLLDSLRTRLAYR